MDTRQTIRDHATFRTLLQAMSRPGTVQLLPEGDSEPLVNLLASLLDNESTIACIDASGVALLDEVARATGCRYAALAEADFVLVPGRTSNGQLSGLRRGTPEYPEAGATVIYLLDALADQGGRLILSGPGIRGRAAPLFHGIADDELLLLGEVNRDFPLGIDAIFLDLQGRLACIPRSTRIGVE